MNVMASILVVLAVGLSPVGVWGARALSAMTGIPSWYFVLLYLPAAWMIGEKRSSEL